LVTNYLRVGLQLLTSSRVSSFSLDYDSISSLLLLSSTVKTPGMFATIVVILPSRYTGGQVHVSHSDQQKVFDFSSQSLTATSILAWYTDVMHEVKPITSGFRLALSYNLVHTSPGVPPPMLPDTSDVIQAVRRVFDKWRKGLFETDSTIIAYILDHKYSPSGLTAGASALKGQDAFKLALLKDIAHECGYLVCLGNLVYEVSSSAADSGCRYGYYKRRRWSYYDSDFEDEDDREETPEMEEVDNISARVENLVDLDGRGMIGLQKIDIEQDGIVPKNAFEDVEPDDRSYEGYMGNVRP
jgi:hypothetical protein